MENINEKCRETLEFLKNVFDYQSELNDLAPLFIDFFIKELKIWSYAKAKSFETLQEHYEEELMEDKTLEILDQEKLIGAQKKYEEIESVLSINTDDMQYFLDDEIERLSKQFNL